jgi:hypothetical protein
VSDEEHLVPRLNAFLQVDAQPTLRGLSTLQKFRSQRVQIGEKTAERDIHAFHGVRQTNELCRPTQHTAHTHRHTDTQTHTHTQTHINTQQTKTSNAPPRRAAHIDTATHRITHSLAHCSMLYPGLGSLERLITRANRSRQFPTASKGKRACKCRVSSITKRCNLRRGLIAAKKQQKNNAHTNLRCQWFPQRSGTCSTSTQSPACYRHSHRVSLDLAHHILAFPFRCLHEKAYHSITP